MKKKSSSTNCHIKKKGSKSNTKKATSNTKAKLKPQKQQIQDYMVLNGVFYPANTYSQRYRINNFLQNVRETKQLQRKSFLCRENHHRRNHQQPMRDPEQLEEYARSLSPDERKKVLKNLEEELNLQKLNEEEDETKESKYEKFEKKLENIEMELSFKWEQQIDKINTIYIHEEDRIEKIDLMNRIKNHKLRSLECTRILFEKILKKGEKGPFTPNYHELQDILKSLNSFSSFQQLSEQEIQIAENSEEMKQSLKLDPISAQELKFDPISEQEQEIQNKHIEVSQAAKAYETHEIHETKMAEEAEEVHNEEEVHKEEEVHEAEEANDDAPQDLKLDIRLDQVQFGKQEYDDQQEQLSQEHGSQQQERFSEENCNEMSTANLRLAFDCIDPMEQQLLHGKIHIGNSAKQFSEQAVSSKQDRMVQVSMQQHIQKLLKESPSSPIVSPQKQNKENKPKLETQFYEGQLTKKLKLPLNLLKRNEEEQSAAQLKDNQEFRESVEFKISFQLSKIPQDKPAQHFTTLVDVNNYLVGLYEFLIRKYLNPVIDGLSVPYGKSAVDKLYSLQNSGVVDDDHEMFNLLSDEHFKAYQQQITLSIKRCTQHEKVHNKALFEAFNFALNLYRPYYELDGEAYPWLVSEKGMTFYEINDENVEEVFEKSKLKVLEYCSSLCGLMPFQEPSNHYQKEYIKQKHEEYCVLTERNETLEMFHEWELKIVNYDAMCRLIIAEAIYTQQIASFLLEVKGENLL